MGRIVVFLLVASLGVLAAYSLRDALAGMNPIFGLWECQTATLPNQTDSCAPPDHAGLDYRFTPESIILISRAASGDQNEIPLRILSYEIKKTKDGDFDVAVNHYTILGDSMTEHFTVAADGRHMTLVSSELKLTMKFLRQPNRDSGE
jgi:hypothetical protein